MSIKKEQLEPAMRTPLGSRGNSFDGMSGQFPLPEYYLSNSVNYSAKGAGHKDLYTGGAVNSYYEERIRARIESQGASGAREHYQSRASGTTNQTSRSQYPLNQVNETESGHIIEIDDTPGHQRVLIRHNLGSGVELRNDGSVLIATGPRGRKDEIVQSNYSLRVEADGTMTFGGNLNLACDGDFNLSVGGNYNVNVEGNKSETIGGSSRDRVHGSRGSTISGGSSTTVVGQSTNTHLGGLSQNVKGVSSHNVDGTTNFLTQGDMRISSGSAINMSSPSVNVAANSLSMFGDTGTIGGENIIMYNYNMYTGHSIQAGDTITTHSVKSDMIDTTYGTASTWAGNLEGVAKYSAAPGTYTGPTTVSARITDNTATALPTSGIVTDYLANGTGGVATVSIDAGDFMINALNLSDTTGGVTTRPATSSRARSALRDPANRSNSKYVGHLLQTGAACVDWNSPTPEELGRIISRTGSSSGVTSRGPDDGLRSYSISTSQNVTITPDPQYNPFIWYRESLAIGGSANVSPSLPLAPGVTLAKFLGSDDDPTTMNHIKGESARLQLAKYYYVHATHIQTIQEDTEAFNNVSLVVAEGMYRPGPGETITPDSINDLKSKGRAVVYNVVDNTGNTNLTRLFDVAAYWKNTIKFDKMILSYDTLDCQLNGRIIVTLPEIDDQWNGKFRRLIETEFNNHKLTEGELVEVLSTSTGSNVSGGVAGQTGEGYSGSITGNTQGLDRRLIDVLESAAADAGVNIVVSSGNRGAGGSGRHNGCAADVMIYSGNKLLNLNNGPASQDTAIVKRLIRSFILNSRSKGYSPSVGAANNELSRSEYSSYVSSKVMSRSGGPLYMSGTAVHLDIARGICIAKNRGYVWGGSGETANVPPPNWLVSLF